MADTLPFEAGDFRIVAAPPMARLVLHGRRPALDAASAAFGVALSPAPSRAVGDGFRTALHLGPDEWWLLAPVGETALLQATLGSALQNLPHSLVDIGARQWAIRLSGPSAATVLAAFCPLDLHPGTFPVGACTRTLLGKAGIMLWRTGADEFHLETGRSFAGYVQALLISEARSD